MRLIALIVPVPVVDDIVHCLCWPINLLSLHRSDEHIAVFLFLLAVFTRYVAVDAGEGRFLHVMKEAAEALRVAFCNEKASGHSNPVNVSAVVGTARAHAVKSVAAESALPCLLWWASGPDVMSGSEVVAAVADGSGGGGDVHSDTARCTFLSELRASGVTVDLAVVCMKYGAEWAAEQLCSSKVARCAVWIAVDPVDVGHGAVLRSAAALVRDMLRRPLSLREDTQMAKVGPYIDASWQANFATLTDARHGVVQPSGRSYAEGQQGLFTSVRDASTAAQAIRPLVPRGNYFERVMSRGAASGLGETDVAHVVAAKNLGDVVLEELRNRHGPSVVHVVPMWEPVGTDEAVVSMLHNVCGRWLCGRLEVQFVCDVALSPQGALTDDALVGVPRHESGIVWLYSADDRAKLIDFDVAESVWRAVEDWRKSGGGDGSMSGWVFVVGTSREGWRQLLEKSMYAITLATERAS
jgi:hypothetical protein